MTKAVRATGIPVSRIENPVSRPVISVSRTEIPVRTISVNEDCVDDACCVYAGFPDAL